VDRSLQAYLIKVHAMVPTPGGKFGQDLCNNTLNTYQPLCYFAKRLFFYDE
jgi:hypothetical protein